jgi:ABC-type uncharacterized transport system permease subunit
MSNKPARPSEENRSTQPSGWSQLWDTSRLPLVAVASAFLIGAIVIWITSFLISKNFVDSLWTVWLALSGLIRGAFFKQRGFSETLVATTPYIFLALGVALGFKSGLFNIGVEGQFYIGAISAVYVGFVLPGLPAIIHLPLVLLAGAVGGAIWAGIPGYLKARFGAHEVITTIMMNYVAFRLVEYLISGPIKDPNSTATQTPPTKVAAQLWAFWEIPQRLRDPLNALLVAILIALIAYVFGRWWFNQPSWQNRLGSLHQKRLANIIFAGAVGVVIFVAVPLLTRLWWPFTDQYDRLHIGIILAILMAYVVYWLLWKTTLGFELRMVGSNPNAARYAGVNITRNIVVAMALSGALAGIAGAIEVLGVSTCRCMQLFFSSGYGFDSIAIALLAKNNPFGIIFSSLLFGAMRNGADFMELNSGVSKYIISLIQALLLLFVAAPSIIRGIYRMKAAKHEEEMVEARGWGR